MHGRKDIIRSQMFYSVYTKVTHSNHQRTSTPTNLAQSELVSKLPAEYLKDTDDMWKVCL